MYHPDGITTDIYPRQMNGAACGMTISYVLRIEGGDPVADAKPYPVIRRMHGYPVHIFPAAKAVTVKVVYKMSLLSLVLPDTHCRTTPKIAGLILHNAAHHLVRQHFCPRERHHIALAVVIEIQSCIRSDKNLVLRGLKDRHYSIIIEYHLPSIRTEMVFCRIIAIHPRSRTNPQLPLAVEKQV